jgi:hypothetical protein
MRSAVFFLIFDQARGRIETMICNINSMNEKHATENEKKESLRTKERMEIREKMQSLLRHIAEATNKEFALTDRKGKKLPIVDSDNCIEMRSFYTKVGGPYKKTETGTESDLRRVDRMEREFAHVEVFEDHDARLAEWKDTRTLSDPSLAESAMTILLHKALGEDYIVAKSSKYDDYVNGVDNVVLNKQTGKVVCAFDELVNIDTRDDIPSTQRYQKKIARAKKKLVADGGMDVKYGVSRDTASGEYLRSENKNVPAFCIAIDKHDLYALVREMGTDLSDGSDIELKVVGEIVKNLEEQKEILLNDHKKYSDHIQSMNAIIDRLRSHL